MVSKGDNTIVLWPRYFDESLSRAEGRRVATAISVKNPDAKWIESAAKKCGFDATVESDAKDPALSYKKVGRVLLAKNGSKESMIQAVAKQMSA